MASLSAAFITASLMQRDRPTKGIAVLQIANAGSTIAFAGASVHAAGPRSGIAGAPSDLAGPAIGIAVSATQLAAPTIGVTVSSAHHSCPKNDADSSKYGADGLNHRCGGFVRRLDDRQEWCADTCVK